MSMRMAGAMRTEGGLSVSDLLVSTSLPEKHDPLAAGILMAHQTKWLADPSPLKLASKGRRTGITYAEALDDCIIAATARSAGGDNVYYIPDVKEKGLEYIRYVAHFARVVQQELAAAVEEYLFADEQPDGSTKFITAYRVRFASGYQVVALASRPANIRSLQGIVVVDEAAFHRDVVEVIDAVNALLIWGGKIRIISSHNGEDNPFNLLIRDTRAGHYDYKIHHIPFSLAVKNGLYERVCLMRGWRPTAAGKQAWLNKITRSYGPRHEARDEELEAIPRRGSGVYLPRALVQRAQRDGIPVLRWSVPETFYLDDDRLDVAKRWIKDHLQIHLDNLDPKRRTVFGQDFGRDGDLSVIVVGQEAEFSVWETAFAIELRRCPFDVQQALLFHLVDALPRMLAGKLDGRGNGQSHAEAAQQKYGAARIECVMATPSWYAAVLPVYRAALEEKTFILPAGEDVVTDHRLVILKSGSPAMSDQRLKGEDGEWRHGDFAVAAVLAHAATAVAVADYAYRPAPPRDRAADPWMRDDDRAGGMMLPRLRGGL